MYLVCRLLLRPPPTSTLSPYTTLFRSQRGDRHPLLGQAGGLLDRRLDGHVWHHLAADLREPAQAVGDPQEAVGVDVAEVARRVPAVLEQDRKSTRLNSSHRCISYAVFCFAPHRHLPSLPTRRSSDLSEVTATPCSVRPAASWIAASTAMCGTISPPIFENRLRRSVIRRKPSAST